MTKHFTLADGFQDPDMSAWQELAQKALKGASLDRLTTTTHDGIAIKPLYTARDVQADSAACPATARDRFLPWDMRQTVLNPDPVHANSTALGDLALGVSSLEFQIDPTGACGVAAHNGADFASLTQGILTNLATIAIGAPHDPIGSANHLAAAIGTQDQAGAKIAFNLDPMAQIMIGGGALSASDAGHFAKEAMNAFPCATALRADARPIHEGGGSDGQELAVLIASGIAHLKAGEAAGMTPAQVNQTLLFTLSVGPDVVLEIAKLKAARRLWARVLDACSVAAPMKLQAVTSGRMQSIADPWTNILRATCAAFGAGAGGADVVTVLPFTSAFALADEQARRIARNTQLVLQEESHLGRVADPAAGAWAMEAIADDLAHVAWGLVQEIERAGGLGTALTSGLVQGWVATTRAARERDIARRKTALVGVSVFPNLGEALPSFALPSSGGDAPRAERGTTNAIPPMRLAAPFEALRAKPNGTIFLATLGPIAKFNARSGFAKNAFEAGGIQALGGEDVHGGDQAVIAAFAKSVAKIACLCGDDDTYQTRAAPLAQALKQAGAKVVWLAGKGSFQSVDRTIFAGADILAELTFAHEILEGAQ
jgi:methylmalonyl-CoA mutase